MRWYAIQIGLFLLGLVMGGLGVLSSDELDLPMQNEAPSDVRLTVAIAAGVLGFMVFLAIGAEASQRTRRRQWWWFAGPGVFKAGGTSAQQWLFAISLLSLGWGLSASIVMWASECGPSIPALAMLSAGIGGGLAAKLGPRILSRYYAHAPDEEGEEPEGTAGESVGANCSGETSKGSGWVSLDNKNLPVALLLFFIGGITIPLGTVVLLVFNLPASTPVIAPGVTHVAIEKAGRVHLSGESPPAVRNGPNEQTANPAKTFQITVSNASTGKELPFVSEMTAANSQDGFGAVDIGYVDVDHPMELEIAITGEGPSLILSVQREFVFDILFHVVVGFFLALLVTLAGVVVWMKGRRVKRDGVT